MEWPLMSRLTLSLTMACAATTPFMSMLACSRPEGTRPSSSSASRPVGPTTRASHELQLSNAIFYFETQYRHSVSGDWPNASPEMTQYLVAAFSAAVAKLKTDPDLAHPWPASAIIGRLSDGQLRLTYEYVEEAQDMVGVVILNGDSELGRYLVHDYAIGASGPTAFRYDILTVSLVEHFEIPADVAKSRTVGLPRSALSGSLRLKLLGRKGETSYPIRIFVDPTVLREATTKPGAE